MRIIKNEVWVKVAQELEDTIKFGTLNLYVDNSYFPESHTRIFGEVVVIPESLTKGNEKSDPPQQSFIDALCISEGRPFSDIKPIVKVGNTIYFHRNAIDESRKVYIGEEVFFRVSYEMIFLAIKTLFNESMMFMVGGHILAKPIKETEADLFLLQSGIWKRHIGTDKLNQCTVTHHDHSLLSYEQFNLKFYRYEKCWHKPNANFTIKIDGEEQLIMRESDIVAFQLHTGEVLPSFLRVIAEEVIEEQKSIIKVFYKDTNSYRKAKGIKVRVLKVGKGAEHIKVGETYHVNRIDSIIDEKTLIIRVSDFLCEVNKGENENCTDKHYE